MKPITQYTRSGRINIAYQVFGSGPTDLVYIPGWVSNIDWMWLCPQLVDFLTELGKITRVILFDKRGTGLSDRVVELSTLEERMDDIRAVMDAVGSEKAILFGHSEGGSVSALFAATYPNRTISLITFGIFAKRSYAPNYPWAPTDAERQEVYDMIEKSWGSGEMNLESLAPSMAGDRAFMDWLANYFRSGASPSAAMVLTRMNTEVDIINILGSIQVPTLILQRTDDVDVKIEEGKFIADHIPGSEFVELPGNDHLFWVGDTASVLQKMRAFIIGIKPKETHLQQLFTIAAARLIAAERAGPGQQEIIAKFVSKYRGKVIQCDGRTFFAIFDGPSKAVHCYMNMFNTVEEMNAKLAVGIHIKEAAVDEAHFVSAETEAFVESILEHAKPNQILITQTVKYLLSGAGLYFSSPKSIFHKNSGEPYALFNVTDDIRVDGNGDQNKPHPLPDNGSFLENVLQVLEAQLGNEFFGVEMLCREMGVSERQLQRKLKAITNKSPIQLISSVRLHKAKQLLIKGEVNIAEAGYRTGFSDPSYFSKSFKKEFGSSPTEFLKNCK